MGSIGSIAVREFVIQERKKPRLVKSSPGLTEDAPVSKAGSQTPRRAAATQRGKKRGQLQFVVAYGGVFVGFFEAESEITPREAFIRVSADLGASDEEFDPDKLEIYKPVLLRGARPANGCPRVKGKLQRVGAKT